MSETVQETQGQEGQVATPEVTQEAPKEGTRGGKPKTEAALAKTVNLEGVGKKTVKLANGTVLTNY